MATTQRSAPSVACPHCGELTLFSPDNPWRPFCSKRCKMIDLGAWANESYRIPAEIPVQENDPIRADDAPTAQ